VNSEQQREGVFFPADAAAIQHRQDLPVQNVVQVRRLPFPVGKHCPALGISASEFVCRDYRLQPWDDWHWRFAALGFQFVAESLRD
jgi:hypothetical protein